jgi:hypothetical protein
MTGGILQKIPVFQASLLDPDAAGPTAMPQSVCNYILFINDPFLSGSVYDCPFFAVVVIFFTQPSMEPQHLPDLSSAFVVPVSLTTDATQRSSIAVQPSALLTPLEVITFIDESPADVLLPNKTANRPSIDGQQRMTSIGHRIFAFGAAAQSIEPLAPLPMLPPMPSASLTIGSGYTRLFYNYVASLYLVFAI